MIKQSINQSIEKTTQSINQSKKQPNQSINQSIKEEPIKYNGPWKSPTG